MSAVLQPLLEPLGFRRHGLCWQRRIDDFYDVIQVQVASWGAAYTFNLGVLDPALYALVWDQPLGQWVPEARCTVRARLGQLTTGRDHWWTDTTPETLTSVAHSLLETGVPFLIGHHNGHAMLAHLQPAATRQSYPPPVIWWAALSARYGQLDVARARLEALARSTSDSWKPVVQAALQQLAAT